MLVALLTEGFEPVAVSVKKPDFSAFPLPELREMAAELARVIEEKEKAEKATLAADIEALAKERGFSLTDILPLFPGLPPLVASEKPKKTTAKADGGSVPPKYRNPANAAETWSGRGKRPKWVNDALAAETSLESMLIVNQ